MKHIKSTLMYKWFNGLWNEGKEELIEQYMNHDVIANGLVGFDRPAGMEGYKIFYKDFRAQFDNIHVDVELVVSEGRYESARLHAEARHIASGKHVSFTGICMCRIENGKIAEAWNNFDFLSMYQQLGMKLV